MNKFGFFMLSVSVLSLLCMLLGVLLLALVGGRRRAAAGDAPPRSEMRRFMMLGLYCNPDDPRVLVRRPAGRGWTLNLRREEYVIALQVGLICATIGIILALTLGTR